MITPTPIAPHKASNTPLGTINKINKIRVHIYFEGTQNLKLWKNIRFLLLINYRCIEFLFYILFYASPWLQYCCCTQSEALTLRRRKNVTIETLNYCILSGRTVTFVRILRLPIGKTWSVSRWRLSNCNQDSLRTKMILDYFATYADYDYRTRDSGIIS